MRKILALILTMSMLVSNMVPVYAASSDLAAKKAFFDAATETLEQISNEYYGEGFLEEYNGTMDKLLTNLSSTTNFNFDTTFTYVTYGEEETVDVAFDYNDDGSSILINFTFISEYDGEEYVSKGSFYVDDAKMVVNMEDISDTPIIYNFGDSLEGTGLEASDMEYFKYSNIKKYINLLLDLETSGKLDAIVDDYQANFLEYVAKADFTYENNKITMVIDGELVNEYLNQLATKIRDDKNIKAIYDSFEIDYSYDLVMAEVETAIKDFATELGDSFSIHYFGVITNGVLSSNKFTFAFDDEFVFNTEIEFNDVNNGVLSDVKLTFADDYDNMIIDFSLTNKNDKRTFKYKAYANDDLVAEGNITYTLNGLNTTSTAEVITYSEPFLYVTEEPVKDIMTYDEWYNDEISYYNDSIAQDTTNIAYAKEQLDKLENSNSSTFTFDTTDDEYTFFNDYFYYYYYGDYALEDVVNFETGEVLNKDGTIDVLNNWIEELNTDLAYSTSSKNDITKNSKEMYEEYAKYMNYDYEYMLEEYKAYQEYIANGSPVDAIKQIMNIDSSLTEQQFTTTQTQEVYTNDELELKSFIKYTLKPSDIKNSVNVDGAVNLADYLNNY